jgi:hypothetical protein
MFGSRVQVQGITAIDGDQSTPKQDAQPLLGLAQ